MTSHEWLLLAVGMLVGYDLGLIAVFWIKDRPQKKVLTRSHDSQYLAALQHAATDKG